MTFLVLLYILRLNFRVIPVRTAKYQHLSLLSLRYISVSLLSLTVEFGARRLFLIPTQDMFRAR